MTSPTPEPQPPTTRSRLRNLRRALAGLFCVYLVVGVYQCALKPLSDGLSVAGPIRIVEPSRVRFLHDTTYQVGGQRVAEQMIFNEVLSLVRGAEEVVLADLFLFNGLLGKESAAHRPLSREMADAFIERRRRRPDLRMLVISDPLNEAYGGAALPLFDELRAAGVLLVSTNLTPLRDSNPVYSAAWRMSARWFGTSPGGSLPHPLAPDAGGIGVRSWLTLMNFKANHRKVLVADAPSPDGGRELAALVMSANPHDGSSAHGNVTLLVHDDALARDIWRSEHAVLRFSDPEMAERFPPPAESALAGPDGDPTASTLGVRLLTEGRIREALLDTLRSAERGDSIDVGMFYLADRSVVGALADAAVRGAMVRLILDPNRDAFGYRKNGAPNRPVAAELVRRGRGNLTVRWYRTHGEQFHTKMVLVRRANGQAVLTAGSANLTRRNLKDFNLETNLEVAGRAEAPVFTEATAYFQRLWSNEGHAFTAVYEEFHDDSRLLRWQYLLQEHTGLGTF